MTISFPFSIHREYISGPLELHIARFTWDRGTVGDGKGYSSKLSFKLQFCPVLWVVGIVREKRTSGLIWWFCLLRTLHLRVKLVRSYGGRFP
jgi:hypothetical protein